VRLAIRGRKLLELMACPGGCGEQVVRKNVRFHRAYACVNRSVSCWICGMGNIRHRDLGNHLSQEVRVTQSKNCYMTALCHADTERIILMTFLRTRYLYHSIPLHVCRLRTYPFCSAPWRSNELA